MDLAETTRRITRSGEAKHRGFERSCTGGGATRYRRSVLNDDKLRHQNTPHDRMDPTRRQLGLNRPTTYRITVEGRLDERWAEYFDGLTLTVEHQPDGPTRTVLTGPVADQAALHGVLNRIRDLGLPLRSVDCMAS